MEEEFELSDYFRLIRKHWLMAVIVFMVIIGGVAAYTFTTSPVYEVRSLVMVSDAASTPVLAAGQTQRVDIETQKEIIMSASVLFPVYAQYIDKDFEVDAKAIKNSNVIEITVESEDPVAATRIANSIVDSYVNYTQRTKTEGALEVSEFINEQLSDYKTELNQLNGDLLDIKSKASDYQLELKTVNSEIDNLNKEISNLKLMVLDYKNKEQLTSYQEDRLRALNNDINTKQANYNELVRRRDEIRSESSKLEIQMQNLEQKVAAKEELYNYLLSRREEVSITAKERSANVRVIEYASIPDAPVKPNKPMNLALGFVLAVIGAIGSVVAVDFFKDTFKSIREIEETFGDILGIIPRLKSRLLIMGQPKHKNQKYRIVGKSKTTFVESIHMLRTNLEQKLGARKTFAVTSGDDEDGKSTVASNLAISLAKDGKKVLLIDANLRNPVQHITFKKQLSPGYADVVSGKTELSKAVKSTNQKGMHILTAGSRNSYPTDLFNSSQIRSILKRLNYDIIIFDTPSLEYSESAVVAVESGAALLVIAQDKTKREIASHTKSLLKKLNVELLGVVVNFAR